MSTEAISEEQFLREFTKELHNNNVAAFIGAGFSTSSGYVDWKGLLKDIVIDLGLDPDKEHDLVTIAQYSVNQAGGNKTALTRAIVNNIGIAKKPQPGHEILANLPIHTYWTTNYDKLIEKSLEASKKVPDVKYTVQHLATTRPERDAIVYKMHGDVDHADKAVICKDDYEKYPFKMGQYASLLRGDLIEKTFLFLGFSFTDPNIDFILSRVRAVLDKDQREHYCVQKKITRRTREKKADFEYRQLKQNYFIRDLKRLNILTIEVDDYPDIPVLLSKVATRYRRSSVFVSGAASSYAPWKPAEAGAFLQALGKSLAADGNRVISGFGVGVGGSVINGVLDSLANEGVGISEENLMMRPFPHTPTGRPASGSRWTKYRQSMIDHAGIAIFVFGNKAGPAGTTIDSGGMREEFDLCIDSGVVPIPVGATGYVAETLWKEVDAEFHRFYPSATAGIRKSFKAIGRASTAPEKLHQEINKIIHHLQKD
jgi:hypothetical protein